MACYDVQAVFQWFWLFGGCITAWRFSPWRRSKTSTTPESGPISSQMDHQREQWKAETEVSLSGTQTEDWPQVPFPQEPFQVRRAPLTLEMNQQPCSMQWGSSPWQTVSCQAKSSSSRIADHFWRDFKTPKVNNSCKPSSQHSQDVSRVPTVTLQWNHGEREDWLSLQGWQQNGAVQPPSDLQRGQNHHPHSVQLPVEEQAGCQQWCWPHPPATEAPQQTT